LSDLYDTFKLEHKDVFEAAKRPNNPSFKKRKLDMLLNGRFYERNERYKLPGLNATYVARGPLLLGFQERNVAEEYEVSGTNDRCLFK
jgi:hypothetical protein